jgi:hypothetical protein
MKYGVCEKVVNSVCTWQDGPEGADCYRKAAEFDLRMVCRARCERDQSFVRILIVCRRKKSTRSHRREISRPLKDQAQETRHP